MLYLAAATPGNVLDSGSGTSSGIGGANIVLSGSTDCTFGQVQYQGIMHIFNMQSSNNQVPGFIRSE